MRKEMKITIITVSYNAESTIEQTINSVLMQTYKNIEYVIIDGGSKDKTIDIIKKYNDKLHYWVSEKDYGIYNAYNKGLLVATGDYVQFLNADDSLINAYTIENMVKSLKKNNYPDIFCGNAIIVDEKYALEKPLKFLYSAKELEFGKSICFPGVFIKRDILNEYNFNEKYKIVSDFELTLKLYLNNKRFIFSNIPIVFFGNGGISSTNDELRLIEHYDVLKKYLGENSANDFLKKEKNIFYKIKNKVKDKIKERSYFIKIILGWKKHKCKNKFCRWCNNK